MLPLLLMGCAANQPGGDSQVFSSNATDAIIRKIFLSTEKLQVGENITLTANVVARNVEFANTLWIGCSVRDPLDEWHDLPAQNIKQRKSNRVKFTWAIPRDPLHPSGEYDVVVAAWDGLPGSRQAKRIESRRLKDAFHGYRHREDFLMFDANKWQKAAHRLGKGQFKTANVSVADHHLHLRLPKFSFDGAETRSVDRMLYGDYKVNLKAPDAPGAFTAFFLYQDFRTTKGHDEIDIEIYTDGSQRVNLAVWVGGEMTHINDSDDVRLPFDPSQGFHTYRIRFYPEHLSFYADGHKLGEWNTNLPTHPMKLMVNAWWPKWLESVQLSRDATLQVDWIEY